MSSPAATPRYTDREREDHRLAINRELVALELPEMETVGNSRIPGSMEFLRFISANREMAPWRTFVKFEVILPNGTVSEMTLEYNPEGGAILIPVINLERIPFIKQHRAVGWRWELPRGFGPGLVPGQPEIIPVPGLPNNVAYIAMNKLGPELVNANTVKACIRLGEPSENTGAGFVETEVYLLFLDVPEDVLDARKRVKTPGGHALFAWTPEEVRAETGKKINDFLSLGALKLASTILGRFGAM
jgi:hypothetical protein